MKIHKLIPFLLGLIGATALAQPFDPYNSTVQVYTDSSGNVIPFRWGPDAGSVYEFTFPAYVTGPEQSTILALPQFAPSGAQTNVAVGPIFPPGTVAGFITADVAENSNFVVTTGQIGTMFQVTTGASNITATLPAAATAGDGFYVFLRKVDNSAGFVLTSPTTTPAATSSNAQAQVLLVWTDGTSYYSRPWTTNTDSSGNVTFTSGASIFLTPASTGAGVALGGTGVLANNATKGFPYIPQSAGVPTGVPAGLGSSVPLDFDTANNGLYVYNSGWQEINAAGNPAGLNTQVQYNSTGSFGANAGFTSDGTGNVRVFGLGVGTPPSGAQGQITLGLGSTVTDNLSGQLILASAGVNQNITLTPIGTGLTATSRPINFTTTTASAIIPVLEYGAQNLMLIGNYASTGSSTYIGYQAGNSASTGTNNTALGQGAMKSITSGTNNVAIGEQSEASLTTGAQNFGLGAGVLAGLTTGSNNIAIGQSVLNTITSAGSNVVIGYGSDNNGTGSTNTVMGQQCGTGLTTGSNNLFLGSATGNTITSGSNNVAIGLNLPFTSATASNQLNIGNLIYSATLGFTSTAGSRLMIGTTTDDGGGVLQVAGPLMVSSAGTSGGAATSGTRLVKAVTAIANGTGTAVLTVTVPNSAQSASIKVWLAGSLGAGGAIGANEASACAEYDVITTRTAGVNATALIATVSGVAATSVAGGDTVTLTAALSAISGAVGATNSFTIKVTITDLTGSATNDTCQVQAEVLNANASGVTIN